MEIILIRSVRKLGKVGEVVRVKNGFGRNYLIPNGMAIRATEVNRQKLESERSMYESKNDEERNVASSIASEIQGKDLIFIRQSSDDKRLFGSVSAKEIAKELCKHTSHEISYTSIMIDSPIKTLGLFTVTAMLHVDVAVKVNVLVVRSQSEAMDILSNLRKKEEDKNEDGNDKQKQIA